MICLMARFTNFGMDFTFWKNKFLNENNGMHRMHDKMYNICCQVLMQGIKGTIKLHILFINIDYIHSTSTIY
jgi:hypothetical protein